MKKIILKSNKEAAVRRFHPWVFSGAIHPLKETIEDGELVEVFTAKGAYLATGHYQDGSICIRLFSFEKTAADTDFWIQKITDAWTFRYTLGLIDNPTTNCYRLVHAEGDGLPGLIIDIYHKTAVVQCHSIGMHRNREEIAEAIIKVYGKGIEAIYDKSKETLPREYAQSVTNGYLFGEAQPTEVLENGFRFKVDWEKGQKTGFFLDQRDNRHLLHYYAQGKKVLNTFAYSGGFSIYALGAKAESVVSVDISAQAMQLTDWNVDLNKKDNQLHQSVTQDVMEHLKQNSQTYNLMIVDPPAFAKNIKKRHNAVQAYKRLNALAIKRLQPGGMLFTFSCSQVVDKALFYNTVVAAALEAKRQVRVMHHLSQPPDHPVSLYHPEGSYLKGLVLYVK